MSSQLEVKDKAGKVLCVRDSSQLHSLGWLDLRGVLLAKLTIEGVHLDDSDLTEGDLSGADFYWAYAENAIFDRANLRACNLRGATLSNASFRDADLTDADLSRDNLGGSTELQGADLTGALLDWTVFTGAEYDDQTIFPDGFDPAARGMIKGKPGPAKRRKQLRREFFEERD